MAKEEAIEIDGIVENVLPNTTFRVLLTNGHYVLATVASCPRWWRARSGRSSTARETSCWAARSRRCRRSRSLLLWPSVLHQCARGVIGRPLLRLELVERRPDRVRPEPLGAAVHVLNTRASHDAVFPSARAAAGHVLPHVPRPLPPAARVGVGHLGQLVVREHRTSQAQQDTQATLKVVGREGQIVPHKDMYRV